MRYSNRYFLVAIKWLAAWCCCVCFPLKCIIMYKFDAILNIQMFLNELLVKHSKFLFINTLNTIPIPYAISFSFNQFFQLNLLIYRITIHLFFQITLILLKKQVVNLWSSKITELLNLVTDFQNLRDHFDCLDKHCLSDYITNK